MESCDWEGHAFCWAGCVTLLFSFCCLNLTTEDRSALVLTTKSRVQNSKPFSEIWLLSRQEKPGSFAVHFEFGSENDEYQNFKVQPSVRSVWFADHDPVASCTRRVSARLD